MPKTYNHVGEIPAGRDDRDNPCSEGTYFLLPASAVRELRQKYPVFFGRRNAEDCAQVNARSGEQSVILAYVTETKTIEVPPPPPLPIKKTVIVRIDE